MQNLCSIFHLRWVLWIAGVLLFFKALLKIRWFATPFGLISEVFSILSNRNDFHQSETALKAQFRRTLKWTCFVFFLTSLAAKFSQWNALQLNSQDFWLFVDLLEQMKKGGFFITRFAPQALGYVQHGSVHPTFSWVILLPFAYLVGSVTACLLFNPVCLAVAGWFLGLLAEERMSKREAWLMTCAFLCSTQVGRVMMYDVHPEVAYPLLTFLFCFCLRNLARYRLSFIGIVLLFSGLKEDSFLILIPLLISSYVTASRLDKRILFMAGVASVSVWMFQMWSIKMWVSGEWGSEFWNGKTVFFKGGASIFQGKHWSGILESFQILKDLVGVRGGALGLTLGLIRFLSSRAWLSLIIFAPWVTYRKRFFFRVGPLLVAYSLLDGPNRLWTYYSAIFLGVFWISAIDLIPSFPQLRSACVSFCLGASLLCGSQGLEFYFPKSSLDELKTRVNLALPLLRGEGVVSPSLLSLVPLQSVYSDRFPIRSEDWDQAQFVLFAEKLPRFEMNEDEINRAKLYLRLNPRVWNEKVIGNEDNLTGKLLLFSRTKG